MVNNIAWRDGKLDSLTYFGNTTRMNANVFHKDPFASAIEPLKEMAAYEALWKDAGTSFKRIAALFASRPGARPSDLVDGKLIDEFREELGRLFDGDAESYRKLNILIQGAYDYPARLRDAKEPVEVLYYQGNLDLLATRSIAVVGSREASQDGLLRTEQLVKQLVADSFTIVSGLAAGIDTTAHKTAIAAGGQTIGVIGTPLTTYYPAQNKALQDRIAEEYLLVSQIPFYRYSKQDFSINRFFFPERNKTMSALTEGTIIVEASDKSGTLIQARAALEQGRKLFILESCFENTSITWPHTYEKRGAIRVRDYQDIKRSLQIDGAAH